MNHKLLAGVMTLTLAVISIAANAQGRRPSGATSPAAGQRPSFGHVQAPHSAFRTTQQQSEQRRLEAEQLRQAAEQRRLEAEANSQSDEARAEHPPNEHAADEATDADQNAENSELRDERRALQQDNRQDHSAE
jgi:hypothetical protein